MKQLLSILILLIVFFIPQILYAGEDKEYCLTVLINVHARDKCLPTEDKISQKRFCEDVAFSRDNSITNWGYNKHSKKYNKYCLHKNVKSNKNTKIDKFKNLSDFSLCRIVLKKDGEWRKEDYANKEYFDEKNKRNLKKEKCIKLTSSNSDDETNNKVTTKLSEKKIISLDKKSKIKLLKNECNEIGFIEGSEGMANCVLKLMELDAKDSSLSASKNESNTSLKKQDQNNSKEKKRDWGKILLAIGELAGEIAEDRQEERDKKNAWTAAMREKANNQINQEGFDCRWVGNPGYENLSCRGSSGKKLKCRMVGEKLKCR